MKNYQTEILEQFAMKNCLRKYKMLQVIINFFQTKQYEITSQL